MKGLMFIFSAGLISAVIIFATNWLALIPWRGAKGKHWTERARLYYPVRNAAVSNLWVLPAVLSVATLLLWPTESPYWAFVLLATTIGAIAGTLPMDREVNPRIPLNELLQETAMNWLIRFLLWFVFLGAIVLMPDQFNIRSVFISGVFMVLCIFWNRGGWIWVGQKIGLFLPPPERLQRIIRDTASGMNVSFNEIFLVRSSLAQAYALPITRKILFTERILQLCPDDEIAAICTHELAHLTEALSDYYKRYVMWLIFLPWLFFKPMLHAFGPLGFFVLLSFTLIAPVLYRKVCHKLEMRADHIAQANEPDAGIYARALARLYEDNLLPAVHGKKRATHPHLYDRLLAAGMTPDFPRPAPAKSTAWHGNLFAFALALPLPRK